LSTLLDELKRYRDAERYQQHQASVEAVTTRPEPPAEEAPGDEPAADEAAAEQ